MRYLLEVYAFKQNACQCLHLNIVCVNLNTGPLLSVRWLLVKRSLIEPDELTQNGN